MHNISPIFMTHEIRVKMQNFLVKNFQRIESSSCRVELSTIL
jgi:hypothetical protein